MWSLQNEHTFATRHHSIDLLRNERETGETMALTPQEVEVVLEELALLQIVAKAADDIARIPPSHSEDVLLMHLRNALRRWKE
jgi:hypothetical protein